MKQEEKALIAERLKSFCAQKGSQNKAAKSMGISSATLSKVLNNDWETLSDDMWRSIAAQTGHDGAAWQVVATRGYEKMTFILDNAKAESLAMAVTGFAGCGKTEAIRQLHRRPPPHLSSVLLGVLEQKDIHTKAAACAGKGHGRQRVRPNGHNRRGTAKR